MTLQCCFKDITFHFNLDECPTVLHVRNCISKQIHIKSNSFNIYLNNTNEPFLKNDTTISSLNINANSKFLVRTSLLPNHKKQVRIEKNNSNFIYQRLYKQLKSLEGTDDVTFSTQCTCLIEEFNKMILLNPSFNSVTISDVVVNSSRIHPELFNIIVTNLGSKFNLTSLHLIQIYDYFPENSTVASVVDSIARNSPKEVEDFLNKVLVDEKFGSLIEKLTLAGRPELFEIVKNKFDSTDPPKVVISFIIFLNNFKGDIKNSAQKMYQNVYQKNNTKSRKKSLEIQILLISLSIHFGKAKENLAKYQKGLIEAVMREEFTDAVLSTAIALEHELSLSDVYQILMNITAPNRRTSFIVKVMSLFEKEKGEKLSANLFLNFALDGDFKKFSNALTLPYLFPSYICEMINGGVPVSTILNYCLSNDEKLVAVLNNLTSNIKNFFGSRSINSIFQVITSLVNICFRYSNRDRRLTSDVAPALCACDDPLYFSLPGIKFIDLFTVAFLFLLRGQISIQKVAFDLLSKIYYIAENEHNISEKERNVLDSFKELKSLLTEKKKAFHFSFISNVNINPNSEICPINDDPYLVLFLTLGVFNRSTGKFRDHINSLEIPKKSYIHYVLDIVNRKICDFSQLTEILKDDFNSKPLYISLSFLTQTANKALRQYFIGYLMNNNELNASKKLEVLFYFYQVKSENIEDGEIKRSFELLSKLTQPFSQSMKTKIISTETKQFVFILSFLLKPNQTAENGNSLLEIDSSNIYLFNQNAFLSFYALKALIKTRRFELVCHLIDNVDLEYFLVLTKNISDQSEIIELTRNIFIKSEKDLHKAVCIYFSGFKEKGDIMKLTTIEDVLKEKDVINSLKSIFILASNRTLSASDLTIVKRISNLIFVFSNENNVLLSNDVVSVFPNINFDIMKILLNDNEKLFLPCLKECAVKEIFSQEIWEFIAFEMNRLNSVVHAIFAAFQINPYLIYPLKLFEMFSEKIDEKTQIIGLSFLFSVEANEIKECVKNLISNKIDGDIKEKIKTNKNLTISEIVSSLKEKSENSKDEYDVFFGANVDITLPIIRIIPSCQSEQKLLFFLDKISGNLQKHIREYFGMIADCCREKYIFTDLLFSFFFANFNGKMKDNSLLQVMLRLNVEEIRMIALKYIQKANSSEEFADHLRNTLQLGMFRSSMIENLSFDKFYPINPNKKDNSVVFLNSKEFISLLENCYS